jgi:hypothetical protein
MNWICEVSIARLQREELVGVMMWSSERGSVVLEGRGERSRKDKAGREMVV